MATVGILPPVRLPVPRSAEGKPDTTMEREPYRRAVVRSAESLALLPHWSSMPQLGHDGPPTGDRHAVVIDRRPKRIRSTAASLTDNLIGQIGDARDDVTGEPIAPEYRSAGGDG
jgi:hypothetical protein